MRDPLVRWAMAGLILALPVMIFVASATSVAAPPGEDRAALATAAVLGLVEAAVGLGLWLASRERRRLGASQGAPGPIALGRSASRKA
jgi:hypothetical protein